MKNKLMTAMVSAAFVAAPTIASAAPVQMANPASSLSVAKGVRASSPSAKSSKLGGGAGIFGLAIAAGIVAIIAIAVINDSNSDSN